MTDDERRARNREYMRRRRAEEPGFRERQLAYRRRWYREQGGVEYMRLYNRQWREAHPDYGKLWGGPI